VPILHRYTEIFCVEYWRDLEMWVGRSWSLKMAPFDRSHTSSYSSSIVTVTVPCIMLEIKRDIGQKAPIFLYRLPFTVTRTIS